MTTSLIDFTFLTSSNPNLPGSVRLQFIDDSGERVVDLILSPDEAKNLSDSIMDSRSKYLKDGAKTQ